MDALAVLTDPKNGCTLTILKYQTGQHSRHAGSEMLGDHLGFKATLSTMFRLNKDYITIDKLDWLPILFRNATWRSQFEPACFSPTERHHEPAPVVSQTASGGSTATKEKHVKTGKLLRSPSQIKNLCMWIPKSMSEVVRTVQKEVARKKNGIGIQ
ncbi:Uncharacterized protein Adt_28852 [Abeliophyllum distichum]|uniref:Uncharacterized protein n=1 Tax=Abeliophyllum distichum TaxID=126358 RepID=A0ABD1S1X8_9LAMI